MVPPGQKLALKGTNDQPRAIACDRPVKIGAIYCDCRIC
ncbi:hypothetical protein CEV32_3769 [Brucella rhizosphaerae]|uniref:Uncharacterized protein n=1 Tax=Brucella rhizosphaerae TaxID=571254 RepID=A0A256FSJ2_9HYPH|nr:hypothetical protein CEV32_3769 [Brucella rhizosphaerae]